MTRGYVDVVTAPKCFIQKIDEILPLLISVVEKDAQEIWLFGSVARGQAKAMSDLDFMVVGDWETQEQRQAVSLKIELADLRDDVAVIPVDIVVRRRVYLEANDVFPKEVQRDKKVLWRRDNV